MQIGKLTGIVSRFQLRPWRLLQLLPEEQQEDPLSMTKVIAGSPVVDWTRGKAWRGEPLSVKVIGVRAHCLCSAPPEQGICRCRCTIKLFVCQASMQGR